MTVVMQFRLSAKLCALGVSAVAKFSLRIHRRDAENAEITQRTDQTASLLGFDDYVVAGVGFAVGAEGPEGIVRLLAIVLVRPEPRI